MSWSVSFIICLVMALVNLPFVLAEGGSMVNLISMVFCIGLAVFSLVMAAVEKLKY